jgi:putative transposase
MTVTARNFLRRLSELATSTALEVYAWSSMPNHFHILERTGKVSLSENMRSLMSGYAGYFNRRHRRHGHVFQNRFKSIVCDEEIYPLELVRYLHLNPLRAKVVKQIGELERYPYCGGVLARELGVSPQAVYAASSRVRREMEIKAVDLERWCR